jgi:SAM-dependent methyltransferase
LVRQHFREQASTFDRLYENRVSEVQRFLRPAMTERVVKAVEMVRQAGSPSVLDVGCGSGRIAEALLEAGTSHYVGVDFSGPMLELATARLERFEDRIELIEGDFMAANLQGPFDIVVALGLFDYIADPVPFVRHMSQLGSAVAASFPKWTWLKGPIRKLRYEVINSCPIFDYTKREIEFLFRSNGFDHIEIDRMGNGYMLHAWKP